LNLKKIFTKIFNTLKSLENSRKKEELKEPRRTQKSKINQAWTLYSFFKKIVNITRCGYNDL